MTPGEGERKRTNEADSASHYCIPEPARGFVILALLGELMKRVFVLLLLTISLLACAATSRRRSQVPPRRNQAAPLGSSQSRVTRATAATSPCPRSPPTR